LAGLKSGFAPLGQSNVFASGLSWEAGAAGKTIGGQSGGNAIPHAKYYTLTKNGLQIGGAVAGAKFWKDEALNLSLHSLGREFAFAR